MENRRKQIEEAADSIFANEEGKDFLLQSSAFITGAEWADEHPRINFKCIDADIATSAIHHLTRCTQERDLARALCDNLAGVLNSIIQARVVDANWPNYQTIVDSYSRYESIKKEGKEK